MNPAGFLETCSHPSVTNFAKADHFRSWHPDSYRGARMEYCSMLAFRALF